MGARVFFAATDQRGAGGPGACSVLAVNMAEWLLQHPNELPTGPGPEGSPAGELEALIKQGVCQWQALCQVPFQSETKMIYPVFDVIPHRLGITA